MKIASRAEVQALIERGAQLVEVLPRQEYDEEHIPGAINLPLRKVETDADSVLERDTPTVVYCWDSA